MPQPIKGSDVNVVYLDFRRRRPDAPLTPYEEFARARQGMLRAFQDWLKSAPAAAGRPMKSLKMPECGLFCEEKLI